MVEDNFLSRSAIAKKSIRHLKFSKKLFFKAKLKLINKLQISTVY